MLSDRLSMRWARQPSHDPCKAVSVGMIMASIAKIMAPYCIYLQREFIKDMCSEIRRYNWYKILIYPIYASA